MPNIFWYHVLNLNWMISYDILFYKAYTFIFFLSDLFYISHKLVDLYPNDPVSLIFFVSV